MTTFVKASASKQEGARTVAPIIVEDGSPVFGSTIAQIPAFEDRRGSKAGPLEASVLLRR